MAKESRSFLSLSQSAASLRALTYRIASCPPARLPHIAPHIAAALRNCTALLSLPADALKPHPDASQAVTRFRASLTSLLHSREVGPRWAAVVLVKAAVEAGRLEVVGKATGWVQNLLAILKKNDPPTTKLLAVITLTRIFVLTWDDANLVREMTTPNLPALLQAGLTVVEKPHADGRLLEVVLEAFATLIPRHPTIFRTYEAQSRVLLLKILSTTPSTNDGETLFSETHHAAARRLLVLLHHCAPKQAGPEKWDHTFRAAASAAHVTCDLIFRAVNESRGPGAGKTSASKASEGELESSSSDAAGLGKWKGVHAGAERLVVLVSLLETHVQCTTSGTVSFRIGTIIELATRLLGFDSGAREQSARFNKQVSKDEREALFDLLPVIHVAALRLLQTMLDRFGDTNVAVIPTVLELLCDVFATEHADVVLRTASYRLLYSILELHGPSMSKESVAELSLIMRACCDDLLPSNPRKSGQAYHPSDEAHGQYYGAPTFDLPGGASQRATSLSDLHTAASTLLPKLFSQLDQPYLASRLRTRMEQVAVLTRHKDSLIASVLNPPSKTHGATLRASLMPLLAKEFPKCSEVQALLRPRMPIVGTGRKSEAASGDETSDDEEGEYSEEDHDNSAGFAMAVGDNEVSQITGQTQELLEDGAVPDYAVGEQAEEPLSTAPERSADDTLPMFEHANKRPAPEAHAREESSAKRPRASSVVSTRASHDTQTLPSASPAPVGARDIPVPAAVNERPDIVSGKSAAGRDAHTSGEDDVESGDSDFEIPSLTMEASDDGGEDGDADEDEGAEGEE